MSGETEQNISGWTTDTLHAHLMGMIVARDTMYAQAIKAIYDLMDAHAAKGTERFNEKDLRDEQRFQGLQRAIDKAETAVGDKFESVNEFRAQLGDQSRTFLPRLEYDRAHTDLVERVDQMRTGFADHLSVLDKLVGENTARKGGIDATWAAVIVALGVLIGLAGVVIAVLR